MENHSITHPFVQQTYRDILLAVSEFLNDPAVVSRNIDNRLLNLIAALPFIAGCSQPMRIALVHVTTYLLMSTPGATKETFLHNRFDDQTLLARLSLLNTFPDGDEQIIKRGMDLLSLVMIQDHMHDLQDDLAHGKYNPVGTGVWQYEKLRNELIQEIMSVPCAEMENILPLDVAELLVYWYYD